VSSLPFHPGALHGCVSCFPSPPGPPWMQQRCVLSSEDAARRRGAPRVPSPPGALDGPKTPRGREVRPVFRLLFPPGALLGCRRREEERCSLSSVSCLLLVPSKARRSREEERCILSSVSCLLPVPSSDADAARRRGASRVPSPPGARDGPKTSRGEDVCPVFLLLVPSTDVRCREEERCISSSFSSWCPRRPEDAARRRGAFCPPSPVSWCP